MATHLRRGAGARVSGGDFETEMRERIEHAARERTVPMVRPFISGEQLLGRRPHLGARRGIHIVGVSTRWTRLRWKLWIAAPYLVLLAGLGCLSVSVWPQLLPTVGCVLFALSTVWSLVRCVR